MEHGQGLAPQGNQEAVRISSRAESLMTPERWQQMKQIFQSALERDAAERSAFLNQACVDNAALRSELNR